MKVLEELNNYGKWVPFDLQSFLTEEDGSYTVELRVRTIRSPRLKRSKARKKRSETPKENP